MMLFFSRIEINIFCKIAKETLFVTLQESRNQELDVTTAGKDETAESGRKIVFYRLFT